MKLNIRMIPAIIFMAFTLSACMGERVEVPPAAMGAILDSNGYKPDLIPPSRFRLSGWCMQCPKLVIIDVADQQLTEGMDLWMPQSNLLVKDIEVRFTASVTKDPKVLLQILDRVIPSNPDHGHRRISLEKIYGTYAQERIRAIVRTELAGMKIEDVAANRDAVSARIFATLQSSLAEIGAPVQITQFSIAKFNPPAVIVKAFEMSESRKIDLARAEADKNVAIKEAEAELEVEQTKAQVRLAKARAFQEEAKIMSSAATPQWLEMRRLEVMEAMAANNAAVFFPFGEASTALSLQTLRAIQGN